MLNAIKTEDQRTTVEIGMDCIMPRIEIAGWCTKWRMHRFPASMSVRLSEAR